VEDAGCHSLFFLFPRRTLLPFLFPTERRRNPPSNSSLLLSLFLQSTPRRFTFFPGRLARLFKRLNSIPSRSPAPLRRSFFFRNLGRKRGDYFFFPFSRESDALSRKAGSLPRMGFIRFPSGLSFFFSDPAPETSDPFFHSPRR